MKQEFDFYIDERVMVWHRHKFSVEAETLDEAKEIAKTMVMDNPDEIEHDDFEILYDTMTEMQVEDNMDNSTIELFCKEDDELLYENSDKEIWANTNRKNYVTP